MYLNSVETTPNPNSMKLNFDQSLGNAVTYSFEQRENCPEYVARLLDIKDVKSVFVCHDFITLNRDPRADWKPILDAVIQAFSGQEQADTNLDEQRQVAEKQGQVSVLVQTFRGIPIQVKAVDLQGEKRLALASRFAEAAQFIQAESGADYLVERYWADWGLRYGSIEEVAKDLIDEIQGTIDSQELERLVAKALGKSVEAAALRSLEELEADFHNEDWTRRLLAVQELGNREGSVPLLAEALCDQNQQVRRLAAAALGASGNSEAVAPLMKALLSDSSVGVRRTAGDALSDLGDVSAQPAMCQALFDPNKLVRWRAARFLADVGNKETLTFLAKAKNDSEFEVRLEIEAAIERITSGKEGSLPAWKKILGAKEQNS